MEYIEPPYVQGRAVVLCGAVDAPVMMCLCGLGRERIPSIINGNNLFVHQNCLPTASKAQLSG